MNVTIANRLKNIYSALRKKTSEVLDFYRSKRLIKQTIDLQNKALIKNRRKEKFRCVFFALSESSWKYDYVYKLMEEHPRFDPVILVCPIVNYGQEDMINSMNQCFDYFIKKGYNVYKSFDVKTNKYIDVREILHPDVILYTNPYRGLIDDRYYITNYLDILSVYVDYFFNEGIWYKDINDNLFEKLLWRKYLETDFHQSMTNKYATRKGFNTVVTGYPGIESFINGYQGSSACWKNNNKELKRIIWAPHHTIEPVGNVYYSCFLKYFDFMVKIAQKYENKIQIAFKPHPLLRKKLNLLWGKENTDSYYALWQNMPNTSLHEGEYVDLFLTSDAMIHDSGSFLIEYLYVNKPVMRTLNGISLESLYNELALDCLKYYYLANNEQDIERFVQNVINGVDPLKEKRTNFINEMLMPQGSPSENIVNDILYSIDNQLLYNNLK